TGLRLLLIFFIYNCIISYLAMKRSNERAKNIKPNNKLEVIIDKHYNDEYLKKVFPQIYVYREKQK
ncbi:MAG TPA: hypothetical protein PLC53_02490, partial [Bacilli bacterium]|nr:hypothetical protein [Bacilli bacterium]